jgi:hypothetical protein
VARLIKFTLRGGSKLKFHHPAVISRMTSNTKNHRKEALALSQIGGSCPNRQGQVTPFAMPHPCGKSLVSSEGSAAAPAIVPRHWSLADPTVKLEKFRLDRSGSNGDFEDVAQSNCESVLARLRDLAAQSRALARAPIRHAGGLELDRFIWMGPGGGGDPIKIGLFAGIHGDEPAGSLALVELARRLEADPALGEGYQLFIYPVCNPSGFDAGKRFGSSGKDLNREFWKNSPEPEVRLLESEMLEHRFSGLISLHSDDTCDGIYGFVRGAVLAKNLLGPALRSASAVLPVDRSAVIDGFQAENGIISTCYEGILTSPKRAEGAPYEIIFETPAWAGLQDQVLATVLGLATMLAEYRKLLAFAANL